MILSEYIKGILKSIPEEYLMEVGFELTMNDNCIPDDEGLQKIKFKVINKK